MNERVAAAALAVGTPAYVYDLDGVLDRIATLKRVFEGRFRVSYAVKANPNGAILQALKGHVATLDISSGGELARALKAGWEARDLTFSGPAKRPFELEASVEAGVGEMVCESVEELDELQAARRTRTPTSTLPQAQHNAGACAAAGTAMALVLGWQAPGIPEVHDSDTDTPPGSSRSSMPTRADG